MKGHPLRKLIAGLLYLSLAAGANADVSAWEALREGDMRKLQFHADPIAGSDVSFLSEDGAEMTMADYEGRHVVLNFWATWCGPCVEEMPMLDDLAGRFDANELEVVTVATGRNPRPAIDRFFEEAALNNLPKHTDARQGFARSFGVLGLPVTLIIDPEGREIARLQGEATWNSDSAVSILEAVIAD